MALAPNPRQRLAVMRSESSFTAFPALPKGPPGALSQWLESTRVHPISATEWQCSTEWDLGPRVLNDSMFFWFEDAQGWGRVGEEGEPFTIRSGDLMLIPQGAEHMVRQSPGVAMKLFAIHFHAQVFEGINLLDLLGFPAHVRKTPGAPFESASRRLAREYAVKAPGWRSAMAAEILQVLLFLIRHHGTRFHAPGAGRAHAELPRLLPALEAIDRNLDDPELNVGALAKRVFVSEVQFRKLFKRVTGISPVRFIQRRRVERACVFLRGGEMSVEQVADACGFSDISFFSRVFKAWTRTTPGRYRDAKGV